MGSWSEGLRSVAVQGLVGVLPVRDRVMRWLLERSSGRADVRRTARLLLRASLDIGSGSGRLDGQSVRRPLPSIAILSRSQFTDDARVLAERLDVARVLLISREALKAIARPHLPIDAGDLTYRVAAARDAAPMLRYRALLADVWRHLDPDGDVRLVLTANSGYWAEVELGGALEELGVPFVALHKENLKSPAHAAEWRRVYREERATFHGRRILVQNEGERALQADGEVAPAERIEVVGLARLDAFHAHRARTAGELPTGDIVFAGFLPGAILPRPRGYVGSDPVHGLPLPDVDHRPEHLVEACLALHRVAIAVARRLPDRRIVVKTKGGEHDRTWFPRVLDIAADGATLPANLRLVHGGDAAAMTRSAAVLAGLNTTMLLEALAAGRPAVALVLAEAAGPASEHVVDLSGAAQVVHDETTAVDLVVRLADHPPAVPETLDASTQAVLERWASNPDGGATERTMSALRREMARTAGG